MSKLYGCLFVVVCFHFPLQVGNVLLNEQEIKTGECLLLYWLSKLSLPQSTFILIHLPVLQR